MDQPLRFKGGFYSFDDDGNIFAIKILPYMMRTIMTFIVLFTFYFFTQIGIIEQGQVLPSEQIIYFLLIVAACAYAFFVVFIRISKALFIVSLIGLVIMIALMVYYIFKDTFVDLDAILILGGLLIANALLIFAQSLMLYLQMRDDNVLRSKMIISLILVLAGMLVLYGFSLYRIIQFFTLAPQGGIYIYGASTFQGQADPWSYFDYSNLWLPILIIVISVAGGIALFYFLVYKKSKQKTILGAVKASTEFFSPSKGSSAGSKRDPKGRI